MRIKRYWNTNRTARRQYSKRQLRFFFCFKKKLSECAIICAMSPKHTIRSNLSRWRTEKNRDKTRLNTKDK